jgi:hypothetical protein
MERLLPVSGLRLIMGYPMRCAGHR